MNNETSIRAFCALGANLGDRGAQMSVGLESLQTTVGIDVLAVSPWYITASVGGPKGQPDYWNGVAELAVTLEPRALLERMLEIELAVGRDRSREVRFGPRVLDLDLLTYGDFCIDEPGLSVPHPRLEARAFVLMPLHDLAPELMLASGVPVAQRLASVLGTEEWATAPRQFAGFRTQAEPVGAGEPA